MYVRTELVNSYWLLAQLVAKPGVLYLIHPVLQAGVWPEYRCGERSRSTIGHGGRGRRLLGSCRRGEGTLLTCNQVP